MNRFRAIIGVMLLTLAALLFVFFTRLPPTQSGSDDLTSGTAASGAAKLRSAGNDQMLAIATPTGAFRSEIPEWSLANKPPLSMYPQSIRHLTIKRRLLGRKPTDEDLPYLHPSIVDSADNTNFTRAAEFMTLHIQREILQRELDAKLETEHRRIGTDQVMTSLEKSAAMRLADREHEANSYDKLLRDLDKKYAQEDGSTVAGGFQASRASDFLMTLLDVSSADAIPFGMQNLASVASAQAMFLSDAEPQRAIAVLQKALGPNLAESQIEKLLVVPHDKLFTPISRDEFLANRDEIIRRSKRR